MAKIMINNFLKICMFFLVCLILILSLLYREISNHRYKVNQQHYIIYASIDNLICSQSLFDIVIEGAYFSDDFKRDEIRRDYGSPIAVTKGINYDDGWIYPEIKYDAYIGTDAYLRIRNLKKAILSDFPVVVNDNYDLSFLDKVLHLVDYNDRLFLIFQDANEPDFKELYEDYGIYSRMYEELMIAFKEYGFVELSPYDSGEKSVFGVQRYILATTSHPFNEEPPKVIDITKIDLKTFRASIELFNKVIDENYSTEYEYLTQKYSPN